MRLISGDIGGTKTRMALLRVGEESVETLSEAQFPSGRFDRFEQIVALFLDGLEERADAAAFGIAGPVKGRVCNTTNLPWHIDADTIADTFAIPRVELLNDLEATAWGISALPDSDLVTLNEGASDARGNGAVIAAGTGLGEAGLFWNGRGFTPFATEGGHSDFSPRDELEFALLGYLQKRFGHVSWERVVSGPGLVDIFRFLLEHRRSEISERIASRMQREEPAAVIANEADNEESPLCREAMNLFIRLYGAEAGNLALKQMATGGLFIGGGIAPKILPWLVTGSFIEAFRAKGRMSELMESMPVKVILNDRAALLGPAVYLSTSEKGPV